MTVTRRLTARFCRNDERTSTRRDRSRDGRSAGADNPVLEGVIYTTPDGEGYILYSSITAA